MSLKNDELKSMRIDMKKTMKGRPLYFALMSPSSKRGKFRLSKKKSDVKPAEFKKNYQPYDDAKDNDLKGTACMGVCTGKAGVMTLQVRGKPPGAAVGFLTHFLTRELKLKVVNEIVIQQADVLPEVPDRSELDNLSKSLLKKRCEALREKVGESVKLRRQLHDAFIRVENAANEDDLLAADDLLDELEASLQQQAPRTATQTTIDPKQVEQQLVAAKAEIKDLRLVDKSAFDTKLKEATQHLAAAKRTGGTDEDLRNASAAAVELDDMIDGAYQDFFLNWLKDLTALEKTLDTVPPATHAALKATKKHVRDRRWVDAMMYAGQTEWSLKNLMEWRESTDEWKRKAELDSGSMGPELGKGGQGAIFQLNSSRPDAPKLVMKTTGFSKENQPRKYNGAIETFEHEAQLYEKIGPHPNIARCLGVREIDGKTGLVMEAITGGDMSRAIDELNVKRQKGQISEENYWGMMQFNTARTIETLAYIEQQGFLHHDIKPDNIMIDADSGEPKLIDLGIASRTGESARDSGFSAGYTPSDGLGKSASGKADIFAVGGMLYEVLFGSQATFDYDSSHPFPLMRPMQWSKKEGEDAKALKIVPVDEAVEVTALLCARCGAHFELDLDECPECGTEADPESTVREKQKGKYAANTAYVDFVNRLLAPKPEDRMSFAEALEHPFLRDRMLDDDSAREQFKNLVAGRT